MNTMRIPLVRAWQRRMTHLPGRWVSGPLRRRFLPLVSMAAGLVVWHLLAIYGGWGEHVFPGPLAAARSMVDLIQDGTLLRHTVASLYRVTLGFYLAVLCGIPLGIALGVNRTARSVLNPLVQFLRPISPLAWIPLAILWFGIGDRPAVFLIFMSSFFPLAVSAMVAVQGINPVYFQVGANFNFTLAEMLFRIIIPAIFPAMVTALRITVTVAWLVVVAAEMIAVQSGLGYLILDARNALRMDHIIDAMVVIGLIGLMLDMLMKRMANLRSAEWGKAQR